MPWSRLTLELAARAVRNPAFATDLLRVVWRFRALRWYRSWPFLPIPPREYVRWRMYTAYGDYDAIPTAEDVMRYARWAANSR